MSIYTEPSGIDGKPHSPSADELEKFAEDTPERAADRELVAQLADQVTRSSMQRLRSIRQGALASEEISNEAPETKLDRDNHEAAFDKLLRDIYTMSEHSYINAVTLFEHLLSPNGGSLSRKDAMQIVIDQFSDTTTSQPGEAA